MPAPFRDNVVIVTGASRGIGRRIATHMARQGAKVVLAARSVDALESVARECRVTGGHAFVVPTDVTDPTECELLVARAVGQYGRLDTLVNNAGATMAFRFEELRDLSIPQRLMAVNYLGSVYCTYYALPHLQASGGRLVGVASLTARAGVPLRSLYAASKHAMAGFFDSLRIELADTVVSVTMIYPDFVETEVRDRALGPDGRPVAIRPRRGRFMDADTCARLIVDAAGKRRREVIVGVRGKVGLVLKAFAPGLVDRIAKRAIAEASIGTSGSRMGAS